MSDPATPPPAYEEAGQTSPLQTWNPDWREWQRKLMALEFTREEANEYANLFFNNGIEISMIPELNDGILRGIGIEKVGHRIRILRLQPRAPPVQTVVLPPPIVNTARCAWHPQIVAIEKCHRCYRPLCSMCRRQHSDSNRVRYYCPSCHNECVVM